MRIIKCDVCDTEFDWNTGLAQLLIPEGWDDRFDAELAVDVCSVKCLGTAVNAMLGQDEEPAPEPPRPTMRRITPEESSAVTGVRIKGM